MTKTPDPDELPVHQLGRNDATPHSPDGYRLTPNLGDSDLIEGMPLAVKPEEEGKYGSRTGRTERV